MHAPKSTYTHTHTHTWNTYTYTLISDPSSPGPVFNTYRHPRYPSGPESYPTNNGAVTQSGAAGHSEASKRGKAATIVDGYEQKELF